MKVSYQQIADFTEKHKNTIINRLNASTLTYDDQGPGKAKLWNSGEACLAIYKTELEKDSGAGGALDYNIERARAEKERADKLELDNAERRKELLSAPKLKIKLETALVNFKTKISGLPSKLSAMVDEPEEQRRLFLEAKTLIDETLSDLAKGFDCE